MKRIYVSMVSLCVERTIKKLDHYFVYCVSSFITLRKKLINIIRKYCIAYIDTFQ